ncbi:MAG TPA: hypothetical protein VHS52_07555 [Acidimicrobiales bacterium]|jgi:hypothetical protein|nr:hypothetical protein [Acidimicrobiales bacterium]
MPLKVDTKDCTALSDSELSEMADLCAQADVGWDVGLLSKQCEEWVLVTQVSDNGRLAGFSFCTLERIGGTPSVLVGLASVQRGPRCQAVLKALMGDQLRRAVLAFPDEDVLVGTRFATPAAFAAFAGLEDIVPRPGHKATGEERAWARRLAKRFGAEGRVDDRTSVLEGTGDRAIVLDFDCDGAAAVDDDVAAFFASLDRSRGDAVVAFGWAMAESLAALAD